MDLTHANWRKSSHSTQNGSCVEVALAARTTGQRRVVAVRDSTTPHAAHLTFTLQAWRAFTTKIKTNWQW